MLSPPKWIFSFVDKPTHHATAAIIMIIMMPTIIGAKTLTSKISMAIIIMAAMTAIMMDPALPHVLITT